MTGPSAPSNETLANSNATSKTHLIWPQDKCMSRPGHPFSGVWAAVARGGRPSFLGDDLRGVGLELKHPASNVQGGLSIRLHRNIAPVAKLKHNFQSILGLKTS